MPNSTRRSDLYSLGVICPRDAHGRASPSTARPAVEVLQQHVERATCQQLPAELGQYQTLLDGLMAKSRDDRFPTADALLTHLQQQQAA
jgi:hypothetical protein